MNKRTRNTVVVVAIVLSILFNLFIGSGYLWKDQKNKIRTQVVEQVLVTIVNTVRSQGSVALTFGGQQVILVEKLQPVSVPRVMIDVNEPGDVNE